MKKTNAVIMLISFKLVLVCEDICNFVFVWVSSGCCLITKNWGETIFIHLDNYQSTESVKLSYSSWLNKMCSSHSVSFVSARINKKSFKLYGYNKNCETIKSNKQIFGTIDLNCGYSASLRYCVRSGSENVCLPHP